ncbi:MAG: N-6 DNA methylase [Taibaiella sp.]|nr:N-6 DNA methylase [Taibaiella sp.]
MSDEDIKFLAACTIYVSWLHPDGKPIRYNPDKPDFMQYFSDLVASLHPREAMRNYLSLLEQLTAFELHEIQQYIHTPPNIDKVETQTFGTFFNDLINEYSRSDDWKSAQSSTPAIISKFASSIYAINRGGKIFDPFVGYGGTLIQAFRYNFHRDPKIVAGDINMPALQMAEMNALANGCGREYFYHKNAFTDWGNSIEADLIVTVPPLGSKVSMYGLHNAFKEQDEVLFATGLAFASNEVRSDVAAVIVTIAHLNANGKAVVIVPNNILFSTATINANLRELLVSKNIVDGVISLPQGAFRPVHSASCSALLINFDRRNEQSVFFCDMSQQSMEAFATEYLQVIDTFKKKTEYKTLSKWVHIHDIERNDYNLDAKRHLNELVVDESFRTVSEIATLFSGTGVPKSNINREKGIPFLQVGDLDDSPGLNEIDFNKAEYFISDETQLPKNPNYIPDRAVLITKIGANVKATLYKNNGNALCNPNIIVIKTDDNFVLPEYLITQLQSEYVLRQIEAIRHGSAVIHFSQADFAKIRIKIPPIDEQRMFVTSFYGRRLKDKEIVEGEKQEENYQNIIASIQHRIAQYISPVANDIQNLKNYYQRKAKDMLPVTLDDRISGRENAATIQMTFERLQDNLRGIGDTFTLMRDVLSFDDRNTMKELVNVVDLITEASKSLEDRLSNVIFHIEKGKLKESDLLLPLASNQIVELLRNFIINSIRHGFDESISPKVIYISLNKAKKGQDLELHLINNGHPFPDGFSFDDFISYGNKGTTSDGSGIGGFLMKRIVDNHNGKLTWEGGKGATFSIKREDASFDFIANIHFKISLPYIN